MLKTILGRSKKNERGAALIMAIIAVVIMAIMGGTFALLIQNEARSLSRGTAYDQALYVAESGIEDVLYQRSKNQSSLCAPFDDDGALTGAPAAFAAAASSANCDDDPETDADVSDPDNDDIQCWPYNDKLYANVIAFGPNYYCHDGSDPVKCPVYQPLSSWPAKPGGGIGWKDMDASKPVPLADASQSSGQRYSTGLFSVCNDDFVGDNTAVEPAKSKACLSPPCARHVAMLSIVSVGEVQIKPGEAIRRAVKVDITPAALYSGTIDKYVDLTGFISADINGPIHINGWWNPQQSASVAFLMISSLSLAPLGMTLDPPELVSVSFGENPSSPDWQPPLGLSKITYVHLPVRLDIPQVNWRQFEDRMDKLYTDALDMYNNGDVRLLRREDYNPANMYDNTGDGSKEFNCFSPNNLADDCRESVGILELDCRGPIGDRRCCVPNGGDTPTDMDRVHNCNSDEPQHWEDEAFDLYDLNSASYVTGSEPGFLGGGAGPRDQSLRLMPKTKLNLHLGLDCFSDPMSCIVATENRPEFAFMGKHEFNGKVFIDGSMGVGTRTPYHTCGEGDGATGFFCTNFNLSIPGLFDIEFRLGFPHWHVGDVRIKGEMLVNGKMFLADYIRVDGGSIYAADNVIRDESSGINLEINLNAAIKDIVCLLFTGVCSNPILQLFWEGIIFPIFNVILQGIFPWWPEITVKLADVYMDINGAKNAENPNIPNPGVIYTRGDFYSMAPDDDTTIWILNQVISLIFGSGTNFLTFTTARDPVRIWNYGAIVAGGKEIAPGIYRNGNIYFDRDPRNSVLIQDPEHPDDNLNPTNTGYLYARGSLVVKSHIIARSTSIDPWGIFSINSCSAVAFPLDEECAAKGIFYSGGATAGHENDLSMFSAEGGSVDLVGQNKQFKTTCMNPDEPDFTTSDPDEQIACWLSRPGCMWGEDSCMSEFNMRGYVFAGQIGAIPFVEMRIDQDSSVLQKAIERRYFRSLSGMPVDWMEIDPPANLPNL